MSNISNKITSSFRDPSGFLFIRDNKIYRQINVIYKKKYDHLINSGLYKYLIDANLLILHEEVDILPENHKIAYKIIKPEMVLFISYLGLMDSLESAVRRLKWRSNKTDRKDIFSDYTQQAFEHEFKKYFKIIEIQQIKDSKRILYLMERETA